jgi:ankyrin repeat protein
MKYRVILPIIVFCLSSLVQGMENEQKGTEKPVLRLSKKWWFKERVFNKVVPSLAALVLIELVYKVNSKQPKQLNQELQEQVNLLKRVKKYKEKPYKEPYDLILQVIKYPKVIESLIALYGKEEMEYYLKVASDEVPLPLLEMFCNNGIDWNGNYKMGKSTYSSHDGYEIVTHKAPLHKVVQSSEMLHHAERVIQAIDLLLRNGATINCKDNLGATPLHYAASEDFPVSVSQLIREREFSKHEEICLPIVKYLIEQGASVNLQDNNGYTPLYRAICSLGRTGTRGVEVIKYLLAHGADTSLKITQGKYKGCNAYRLTQRLLAIKTKLGTKNCKAYTNVIELLKVSEDLEQALFFNAAEVGDEELIEKLLQAGINIGSSDEEGNTALMRAARCGRTSMVNYLLSKNASKHHRNIFGESAADLARASGQDAIAFTLEN